MSAHADTIRTSVEAACDTSAITASWRRCLDVYHLDPDRAEPQSDVAAWRAASQRESSLLEIASPCLDQLYALLAETNCAIFLTDRRAVLLDVRTARAFDPWKRPPDQWLGTSYAEEELGTNAIGTCIAEQRGITIRGDQHFLTRLCDRVGVSAPLFGPDGTLGGCLALNQSIDAHDARLDTFLSVSLAEFARRIEIELFARAHPSTRLVLASPKGQKPHALLAIDDDDRVVGATRSARRLLALGKDALDAAPNMNELFDTQGLDDSDILADMERRAIARALARHRGNLSATARAIGISRSTLYRKLRAYEDAAAGQTSPLDVKSNSVFAGHEKPSRTSR